MGKFSRADLGQPNYRDFILAVRPHSSNPGVFWCFFIRVSLNAVTLSIVQRQTALGHTIRS